MSATTQRFAVREKVEISKVEAEITPPSYTYKTLEVLKSELVAYTEVSFLVGDDQLSGFHRWFEARENIKDCQFNCCQKEPGY